MTDRASKRPLGRIVLTPKARAKLSRAEVTAALLRHLRNDGGDEDERGRENQKRVPLTGCRRLSIFRATDRSRFWIITEADQSLTRVLLPEDF